MGVQLEHTPFKINDPERSVQFVKRANSELKMFVLMKKKIVGSGTYFAPVVKLHNFFQFFILGHPSAKAHHMYSGSCIVS